MANGEKNAEIIATKLLCKNVREKMANNVFSPLTKTELEKVVF